VSQLCRGFYSNKGIFLLKEEKGFAILSKTLGNECFSHPSSHIPFVSGLMVQVGAPQEADPCILGNTSMCLGSAGGEVAGGQG